MYVISEHFDEIKLRILMSVVQHVSIEQQRNEALISLWNWSLTEYKEHGKYGKHNGKSNNNNNEKNERICQCSDCELQTQIRSIASVCLPTCWTEIINPFTLAERKTHDIHRRHFLNTVSTETHTHIHTMSEPQRDRDRVIERLFYTW